MKIGLIPINIGITHADQMTGLAQLAESLGVESVWTFEHVMVPTNYNSKYPYHKSGKMGIAPEGIFVDPLIALATIAGATSKIRLGTGVNILPQSNPMLMAKQAASLDMLSGGRLLLGLGIGWLQEEYEAMGVPFEQRGARFDDYVQAMRKVWSGEVVEHQSEFLNWHGFKSYPLPIKKSAMPVIIGGAVGKIYQRIARYGDGWFAPTDSPEALAPMLMQLKAVCKTEHRDYDDIEITTMWDTKGGLDQIKRYQDLGVSRLTVQMHMLGGTNPVDGLSRLAEEIISKL